MQLLSPERKRLIVELSSGSRNSLAALALTHTSYQREAEKALYDTLFFYHFDHDSLRCMETLATNPEKAALVRFLSIEYSHSFMINENRRVSAYLSKSLINMHTFSKLRVRSWLTEKAEEEALMKDLGKNLWSVCKILNLLKAE